MFTIDWQLCWKLYLVLGRVLLAGCVVLALVGVGTVLQIFI